MAETRCYKWCEGNITWGSNPFIWSKVCVTIEEVSSGDHIPVDQTSWLGVRPQNKTKQQRKLSKVTVTLTVNGKEYSETKYHADTKLKLENVGFDISSYNKKPEIKVFLK